MIPVLIVALQAAAPAPAAPPDLLDTGAASVVTQITLDAGGNPRECMTSVAGMTGDIDGCLLFAKPDLLARWLGRPLAGLASIAVRLAGVPEGQIDPAPAPPASRRELAAAAITVAPDGTVAKCTPRSGATLDLCRLLPKDEAPFRATSGTAAARRMNLSFALVAVPR